MDFEEPEEGIAFKTGSFIMQKQPTGEKTAYAYYIRRNSPEKGKECYAV